MVALGGPPVDEALVAVIVFLVGGLVVENQQVRVPVFVEIRGQQSGRAFAGRSVRLPEENRPPPSFQKR